MLEFLARSAGTGVVPARIAPCRGIAFVEPVDQRRGRIGGGRRCTAGADIGGLELLFLRGLLCLKLADDLGLLFGRQGLDACELAADVERRLSSIRSNSWKDSVLYSFSGSRCA
jgi:hypothetical protein